MTHIVHVTQPTTAGVGKFVFSLAEHQHSRGERVRVVSPALGELPERCRAGEIPWSPWIANRSATRGTWNSLLSLRRALQEIPPPRVLHLHSSVAGFIGRLLAPGRERVVFQPHAWSFMALTGRTRTAAVRWERLAQQWTNLTVCVSDAEARRGREAGINAASRRGGRSVVIPNGVRASEQEPTAPRSDSPVVVCIGRLSRQKGQDVLLEAWRRVHSQLPGAKLVLVGDGELRGDLEAMGAPGVEFAGWTTDPDMWLRRAALVVAPSRWEGASLTVLEAMAAGRSVVASDVDGMREMLLGGARPCGEVVDVEDHAALADAIVRRMLFPDQSRNEGLAGWERARTRYEQSRLLDELTQLTLALSGTQRSIFT